MREQLLSQQTPIDAVPKPTPASANNGTGASADVLTKQLASQLKPLLLQNGGVAAANVPRFVEVMRAQARRSARSMCIVIIERFDVDARLALQHGDGLDVLHDWVKEARIEAQDDVLLTLLQLFDTFVMDYETLLRVPFGKTSGQLKKHANDRVKAKSAALIAKWKPLVPSKDVKRARYGCACVTSAHCAMLVVLLYREEPVVEAPDAKKAAKDVPAKRMPLAAVRPRRPEQNDDMFTAAENKAAANKAAAVAVAAPSSAPSSPTVGQVGSNTMHYSMVCRSNSATYLFLSAASCTPSCPSSCASAASCIAYTRTRRQAPSPL